MIGLGLQHASALPALCLRAAAAARRGPAGAAPMRVRQPLSARRQQRAEVVAAAGANVPAAKTCRLAASAASAPLASAALRRQLQHYFQVLGIGLLVWLGWAAAQRQFAASVEATVDRLSRTQTVSGMLAPCLPLCGALHSGAAARWGWPCSLLIFFASLLAAAGGHRGHAGGDCR